MGPDLRRHLLILPTPGPIFTTPELVEGPILPTSPEPVEGLPPFTLPELVEGLWIQRTSRPRPLNSTLANLSARMERRHRLVGDSFLGDRRLRHNRLQYHWLRFSRLRDNRLRSSRLRFRHRPRQVSATGLAPELGLLLLASPTPGQSHPGCQPGGHGTADGDQPPYA